MSRAEGQAPRVIEELSRCVCEASHSTRDDLDVPSQLDREHLGEGGTTHERAGTGICGSFGERLRPSEHGDG